MSVGELTTIEIALAADGGYFDQLFVTATSMALNCRRDAVLSFNILDGGISKSDWDYLVEKVLQVHPSSVFNRIPVDEKLFAAFPKWNGNRMAYARLLLPSVLKNIDWIIYSDCDFLWLRDVAELWQERDDNFSVVAVHDSGSWENKEALWFKDHGCKVDGEKYFCSGMCLFNLKKFRTLQLIEAASEILSAHQDVPYVDQTALNIVCVGMVKLASQKWMCFTHQLTSELFLEPSVIHFAGEVPWKFVRKLQQLSDTMLLWHDFNARMRGITRQKSLRKFFSLPQIIWHRTMVHIVRFLPTRIIIRLLCSVTSRQGAFKYLVLGARQFALQEAKKISWHIVGDYGDGCDAGPKAQRDVTNILNSLGFRAFAVRRPTRGTWGIFARFFWFFKCRIYRWRIPRNCMLVMQYPSAAYSRRGILSVITKKVLTAKSIRLVTIVHDISSLRWDNGLSNGNPLLEEERRLFELSYKVIVHNRYMKRVLEERGVDGGKLIPLDLFDYLADMDLILRRDFNKVIAIAGCLAADKTGYLEQLKVLKDIRWNLYGVKFDASRVGGDNVEYKGCFSPEEIPSKLEASFGLIWDGPSIETCTGTLGEYLRINNPHKLSLYLSAGLPVIVWSKAAVAEFVLKNGVGLVVDSLCELPKKLDSITSEDYSFMGGRAMSMAAKVRSGAFTARALSAVEID